MLLSTTLLSNGGILLQLQRRLRLALVVFLSVWLVACSGKQDVKVLKLAHNLDQTTSVHKAMVFLAQRVHELSSGTMRVDIYPGGQLGQEREYIELLQVGSLAMTKVSASPMEGFVPEMRIFSIPYVFRDEDHLWRFLESDKGRELLVKGEEKRLRGMGYYDAGSRSFYSNCGTQKPIRQPKDLAGLKVRVQESQTSVRMIQALGGSATPISWGELYTALQQGVVDAAENNPPSFYLSKHFEVCKLYTLDEHTSVPDVMLISSYIWHTLDAQQQAWLQQAMDESVIYQRKLWAESTREALEAVKAAGVEIVYPDKSEFQSQVQEMHESYRGEPIYELLQAIRAMPQQ
jgi:tripartite ATP-independent transporter DctP family solute receptor